MGKARQIKRSGPYVTWDEALDIAGSREELERVRGKKTVQNWVSAARKTPRGRVVPSAALVELLLDRWRGKRPRIPSEPEELRLALSTVRELYARTRGNTKLWEGAHAVILGLVGGYPKVGKRYRPIAVVAVAADPPSGPTSASR